MRYEIPIANFEEMIGEDLWVGHRFVCNGQNLLLTAIGQAQTIDAGQRVVPVEIEQEGPFGVNGVAGWLSLQICELQLLRPGAGDR